MQPLRPQAGNFSRVVRFKKLGGRSNCTQRVPFFVGMCPVRGSPGENSRLGFMLKKKETPGNVEICHAAIKEV